MSFVEWTFLLGGLAVVGPLIAHLLAKPRFRRVPFTMLRFLRSSQLESQSRRKLRDLLILLLRCAIIVLIAMLFAQPILHIRPKPQRTRNVHFLGLDNSMSMAYRDGSGTYLDRMTTSAVDYIRAAQSDGIFNVCTLADAHWQYGLTKDQALAVVQGIKVSPAGAKMGEFLSALRQANRDALSPDWSKIHVLLLSDFTPNTLKQLLNVQEPVKTYNTDYKPIVSPESIDNAAIIEAHASGVVGDRISINVTVANYGQIEQHRLLKAKVKANESVLTEVNLSPNQQKVYQVQISVDSSEQEQACAPIELSLSPADGLRQDDTFYLAISLPLDKTLTVILSGATANQMFLVRTALDTLSHINSYGSFRARQVLLSALTSEHLDSADILICSGITDTLGPMASDLRSFMQTRGRIIFFITGEPTLSTIQQLWQQDVLPALPRKFIVEKVYVEPKSCDWRGSAVDSLAAETLSNYRIDNTPFKGCWQCEPHPQSRCLWKFKNGEGFVYLKNLGDGFSILVNTSADDSLGSLTKSSASVVFCQYLLGVKSLVGENSFFYGDPIALSVSGLNISGSAQQQLWIETCDAQKCRVLLSESSLLVPDPGGIGWVKTLSKPTIYAGVNLPKGETDMSKPASKELAEIMSRVFSLDTEPGIASAKTFQDKKQTAIWKVFAWTLIFLLLLEPAIANRLKR